MMGKLDHTYLCNDVNNKKGKIDKMELVKLRSWKMMKRYVVEYQKKYIFRNFKRKKRREWKAETKKTSDLVLTLVHQLTVKTYELGRQAPSKCLAKFVAFNGTTDSLISEKFLLQKENMKNANTQ